MLKLAAYLLLGLLLVHWLTAGLDDIIKPEPAQHNVQLEEK